MFLFSFRKSSLLFSILLLFLEILASAENRHSDDASIVFLSFHFVLAIVFKLNFMNGSDCDLAKKPIDSGLWRSYPKQPASYLI